MLKPISRLRSICKGDLNHNITNPHLLLLSIRQKQHVGRNILHSIPVLSIFVLLGIITYSTIVIGFGEVDGEVYAADSTSNTSSLIIDNGNLNNVSNTTDGNMIYSSHTVQVVANSILGYGLTITGPTTMANSGTIICGADGAMPANMANNTWGYGWDAISAADNSMSYRSFSNSAQLLDNNMTIAVSNNAINFTKKLVFAVKFGDTAASGHYKADVKLNLTVIPRTVVNWSVNYDMNGGTGGPSNTNGVVDGDNYTYTIPINKPIRNDYSLVGFSYDGSNTVKYPGDTIALSSSNPNATLYAVWQRIVPWNSITKMQEMTSEACASASVGSYRALVDTRDNTNYVIRKLADGNCWMTTNLTLDLSIKGRAAAVASDNIATDFPVEALPDSWDTTTTNIWKNDNTLAQFSKSPKRIHSVNGGAYQTSYGYYYSWCAATAGTCKNNNSATISSATGSICPKGWRLPESGNFQILFNNYYANQVSSNARILAGASTENAGGTYFLAAGAVDVESFNYGGIYGFYWSRVSDSANGAFYLFFDSGSAVSASLNNKYNGYPIRCIVYSN